MAKGGAAPKAPASGIKLALRTYEDGDVLSARRQAKKVLASTPSDDDRIAAADLIDRTRIPKVGFLLAGGAATVILLMILLVLVRG